MKQRRKKSLYNLLLQNDLISQIPHSTYDSRSSVYTPLQDKMVDFRFQLLFRNDKQKYKRFLNSYLRGQGVYVKVDSKWINITLNNIKRISKPNYDLVLPDNWYKVAKILDNDLMLQKSIGSVSDTINVRFQLQKTKHAGQRQSRHDGDFIQDSDIKRAVQDSIRNLAHKLIVDKIEIGDYICITNTSFRPALNVVGVLNNKRGKLQFVIFTIMKKDDFVPKRGTHWIKV